MGSHLAEALTKLDCKVTILDDLSNGDKTNLTQAQLTDQVRFVEGSVEDEKLLHKLIVEDKPAIVQQIQDGLKHTPWKIHGVNTTGEAIDFCSRGQPDLVIISLTLPEEAAFTLFLLTSLNCV